MVFVLAICARWYVRDAMQAAESDYGQHTCLNHDASSLRKNSLAAAYKDTTSVLPPKEEPTHGFKYFPLWIDIQKLCNGINRCSSQAFNEVETVPSYRKNESQN
jgi:hypothetical protein